MTLAPGPRRGGEDGHSLISSLFGVLMFLILLLFAVQLTAHLHATTVVTTAAFDAARLVSGATSIAPDDPVAVTTCQPPSPSEVASADAHLRGLLGNLADSSAEIDWSGVTGDEVSVRVSVPTPARVLGGVGVIAGLDRIERTITLARECVR